MRVRAWRLLVALAALAAAVSLAIHHPLWPVPLIVAVCGWALATFRRPGLWLMAVPALLPLLNFAPWSGWLIFDEFDLLLLATLAGGYAWLALAPPVVATGRESPAWSEPLWRLVLGLVGVSVAVGLLRGLADTGFAAPGWFQGYADVLNSVRVSKSGFYAILFVPLLRRELAGDAEASVRRFSIGMWTGAAVVAVAVIWERVAYPGWLDFSSPYRTTALFWEMHIGGAALDVYVALATPFVVWALWLARSPRGWAAAALLAVVWIYVCLTTFSRGVYLAVVLSLTLLAAVVWLKRFRLRLRWRRLGDFALAATLLAETAAVFGTGSFLNERLAASDRDLDSRLAHWADGVHLLRSPADWLLGIGAGRLPSHYAASVPRREFSGEARLGAGSASVELFGPKTMQRLGGFYGLTQRIALKPGDAYVAEFRIRALADTDLRVLVCEMHLLYRRRCQRAIVLVSRDSDADWKRLSVALTGPPLDPGHTFAPRQGVLVLSVRNAGGAVALTDFALRGRGNQTLTRNGQFGAGLAHWFPLAQRYFLPWHIDNLLLETLIERGVLGLVASAALFGLALVSLLRGPVSGEPFSVFVAASITGALLVGMVSSVMDVPRVAFLLCFLAVFAGSQAVRIRARLPRARMPRGADPTL